MFGYESDYCLWKWTDNQYTANNGTSMLLIVSSADKLIVSSADKLIVSSADKLIVSSCWQADCQQCWQAVVSSADKLIVSSADNKTTVRHRVTGVLNTWCHATNVSTAVIAWWRQLVLSLLQRRWRHSGTVHTCL